MFLATGCKYEKGSVIYQIGEFLYPIGEFLMHIEVLLIRYNPIVILTGDTIEQKRDSIYEKYLEMYSDSTLNLAEKEQIARSFTLNIDSVRNVMLRVRAENPDSTLKYFKSKTYDPLRLYNYLATCDSDTSDNINTIIIPENAATFYDISTKSVIMNKDSTICLAFVCVSPNKQNSFVYERNNYFFPVIGLREKSSGDFKIYPRPKHSFSWFWRSTAERGIEDFVKNPEEGTCIYSDVFSSDNNGNSLFYLIKYYARPFTLPSVCDEEYFEQTLFQKYNDSTYNFQWYRIPDDIPLGEYAESEKDLIDRQYHYPY